MFPEPCLVSPSSQIISDSFERISRVLWSLCGAAASQTLHGPCCVVVAAAAAHWHLRLALGPRGQHLRLVLGICFGCPATPCIKVWPPLPLEGMALCVWMKKNPENFPNLSAILSSMRVTIELLTSFTLFFQFLLNFTLKSSKIVINWELLWFATHVTPIKTWWCQT